MAIRIAAKGKEKQGITPHPKPSKAGKTTSSRKARKPPRPTGAGTRLVSLAPASQTMDEIHKLRTIDEFLQAGFMIMRRTVDAVIWFAELLWQAKQRLTPEEFDKLSDELSIAGTTAVQYITTARSERIRKLREQDADLPAGAHTLYLIASMDEDEYKNFTKLHKITKDLTTTDVRHFRAAWKEQKELAGRPKSTRAAELDAMDEAANEATAPVEEGADPHEFAEAPEVEEGGTIEPSPFATFEELGLALLDIAPEAIRGSFEGVTPEEADRRFDLLNQMVSYIEKVHAIVSDAQFALANP
jgi:hypothetical protein